MRWWRGQKVRSGWRATTGIIRADEVLGAVSPWRRELEYLKEELKDTDLGPEVRRFYEKVVRMAPDQDIR